MTVFMPDFQTLFWMKCDNGPQRPARNDFHLTTYKARSYIYIFIFVPVWQKNNKSLHTGVTSKLSKLLQFKFYRGPYSG